MKGDAFYTVQELAKRWQCAEHMVRASIASGKLPAIEVGEDPGNGSPPWRIAYRDVVAFERKRSNLALTPPQLARLWSVKPAKVLSFIARGELRAFDVSEKPGQGRPRWRIPLDAVLAFEQRRAAMGPAPRQRRRRPDDGVIKYF